MFAPMALRNRCIFLGLCASSVMVSCFGEGAGNGVEQIILNSIEYSGCSVSGPLV